MVDTGPPYPRGPTTGSNAIGEFQIGVSPIGDIAAFDVWATVLSQYANSPILTGIITAFNAAMDQTANLDDFFDMIFNVLTAQGYGLDVWGNIVGVKRVQPIQVGSFFGMQGPVSSSGDPYNVSPFFTGATEIDNQALTDSAFRQLILAKALANISDGSIKSINQILLRLFPGRGNAYVTDGLDMTMTYTFDFVLSPVELSIVQNSGVLPTPIGVSATVVVPS